MKTAATLVREYGPFPGFNEVHGVTHDGDHIWFASGEHLVAFSPETGSVEKKLDVSSDAGTAFDGKLLYQLDGDKIQKVDPKSGKVVGTLPSPGKGKDSGMAYADGFLWIGQYRERLLHKVDAKTGEVVKTLTSDRFVTGVTWVDGELWHATWEGDESDIRRIDPESGAVRESLAMPEGTGVSGLEAKGELFFCGGGPSGKVRAVKRPERKANARA